jgi:hypothetical protein
MNHRSNVILMFLLGFFATLPIFAEEGMSPWSFDIYPYDLFAVSTEVSYEDAFTESGLTTKFELGLEAFYGSNDFYVDPVGATFSVTDSIDPDLVSTDQLSFDTRLIMTHALSRSSFTNDQSIFVIAGIENRYEMVMGDSPSYLRSSSRIESDSLVDTRLITGLRYEGVNTSSHYVRHGVFAEIMLNASPAAFNPETAYWSISGQLQGFVPLIDIAPQQDRNIFSLYLSSRLGARYLQGASVPLYASFENPVAVRGVPSELYPDVVISTLGIEMRLLGPAIIIPQIVPGITVFSDSAYFSSPDLGRNGVLSSVGAELFVNAFDFIQLGLRSSYVLTTPVLGNQAFVFPQLMMAFHW